MKILIIKTSSMGDVIHALPAVTELYNCLIANYKDVQIDWIIENSFVDIVKKHKYINKIIPVKIRSWRKSLFNINTLKEVKGFIHNLREVEYDYIIDAQGLLKSALLCGLAKKSKTKVYKNAGSVHGLDKLSRRGKYISFFYDKVYNVNTNLHAIIRLRKLFSKIFDYKNELPYFDYGFNNPSDIKLECKGKYLVFLWCTTWSSKKWPDIYWKQLINIAISNGFLVKINSGNKQEYKDALNLANSLENTPMIRVMPPQSIAELMGIIQKSFGVVSVDTGLGHLAAALNKPGVGIFGATNCTLTGFLSHNFSNLAADYSCSPCLLRECKEINSDSKIYDPPCYNKITPQLVWQKLMSAIEHKNSSVKLDTVN